MKIDAGSSASFASFAALAVSAFFVAVLSNQPQGGFVTRKPTVDVLVADQNFWGDNGFGSFFQPNPQPLPQTGNPRRRGGQYYYQPQQSW